MTSRRAKGRGGWGQMVGEDEAELAAKLQELFDEALRAHEAAKYKTSIHKFKILAYKFSGTQFAHISAYNVACGYALSGKKQHALDWLEISVKGGYDDFEHMRADSDLDSLRKEKRYNKLLLDN